MSTIRNLWRILRSHKNRLAPGGPASCEQAARLRRCTIPGAPDHVTGLDLEAAAIPEPDLALLHADGEKVLQAARACGQTPALAVMQIDDLPEIELVFGRTAADRVLDAVLAELTRAAVGKGLVVRTAADTFALLMPGGGARATIAAIQGRFGKPCTIEVGAGRDEILAMPDVMVHPLGPQDSIAQVYDDLCRYIAKARNQGQGARRAMPQRAVAKRAPAPAEVDARSARYWLPQPATIPVPLGLH